MVSFLMHCLLLVVPPHLDGHRVRCLLHCFRRHEGKVCSMPVEAKRGNVHRVSQRVQRKKRKEGTYSVQKPTFQYLIRRHLYTPGS